MKAMRAVKETLLAPGGCGGVRGCSKEELTFKLRPEEGSSKTNKQNCNRKKTPFKTASQPDGNLGINLAKDVPGFYREIYEALQKEIKELGRLKGQ